MSKDKNIYCVKCVQNNNRNSCSCSSDDLHQCRILNHWEYHLSSFHFLEIVRNGISYVKGDMQDNFMGCLINT